MKQFLLLLLAPIAIGGVFVSASAQNELDPVNGIVIAKDINNNIAVDRDNITGRLYQFKVDASDIRAIKLNDALNISNGKITSISGALRNENATDKWVITPIPAMKGVLGRLDINFPESVVRNILIYQQSDNKFLQSVSYNDKIFNIAPGVYRFTLTNVPVDNVPVQKGHETRLKAGFLDVVSEGDWHLYNDTKEKAFTSGNKPKKITVAGW